MPFNFCGFIFLFLPVSLLAYFGSGRLGRTGAAIALLIVASLFFYAWWNPDCLLLLTYYKYFGFAVTTGNAVHVLNLSVADIVLSLGISFFTFTQIPYLVDAYRKEDRGCRPISHLLLVSFLPLNPRCYRGRRSVSTYSLGGRRFGRWRVNLLNRRDSPAHDVFHLSDCG